MHDVDVGRVDGFSDRGGGLAARDDPPVAARPLVRAGRAQRQAVRGRHFARHADDRHAVGPIGRDLEVEHGIAVGERLDALRRRSRAPTSSRHAPRGEPGHVHELAQPGEQDLHSGKLLQEAQVVLVEQPDVVHAVLQHGDALHAHAEREAGDLFRVVADGLEHGRVHHAAAENLEPAGLLAGAAAARRRSSGS